MPAGSSAPESVVYNAVIKVNGSPLTTATMDKLSRLEVSTSLGVPAMFELCFHDEDLSLTEGSAFTLGAAMVIDLVDADDPNNPVTVMNGEITAIEPEFAENLSAMLTIRGYDKSHRLNRATKSVVHVQKTDSDIVTTLCSSAGLSATVEATTQVYKHVFQDNQTDLAFLHKLAKRNGYEILVDGSTLYFRKPTGALGQVSLEWGKDLRSFQPRLSAARQVNQVTVKGWDVGTKQAIVGQATTSSTQPAIGFGQWGGQAAQSAFSSATRVEVRRPVETQAEADTLAKAILDQINAEFVVADGISFGLPNLVAGKKVNITKVGAKFGGNYIVTAATHILVPNEPYETHFTVEGADHRLVVDLVEEAAAPDDLASQYWGGVVPAIVTNVNNTERERGEVKVKFPWIDDALESTWARVASIGGGATRGLMWLPEVNDEVLVAFEHGDFNRPYIVGGLWNGSDAPPEAIGTVVQSGKVETRTLKTRVGHTVRFTDTSGSEMIEIIGKDGASSKNSGTHITFDIANKKLILLSPANIEIKSANNIISIDSSNKVTVTATGDISVGTQSGKVEIKGMTVSIQATGSLELKATGNTTVKGAVVQIN